MAKDSNRIDGRTAALFALAIVMMVALVVAWRIDADATTTPPEIAYDLTIVNEQGQPVPGASVAYADTTTITGGDGVATLRLRGPELAIVEATGMLADGVVVGSLGETEVTLRLLAETGPGGTRTVIHFAGDFMLGRRYLATEGDEPPLVSDNDSARRVVADIAPLFSLADVSTVNLESVIGSLSFADAYRGKRYLLQSPPQALATLDELGVDLVTLGNNHINDWHEAGLSSTLRNLDTAGIARVGGGSAAELAIEPALVDAGDLIVGTVSMTTVTGDYVNDNLPDVTAPEPANLADADRWQYELREFGFGAESDPAYVATLARRPGTMWRLYERLEAELTAGDAADLWREMVRTYPELQDWVARRGHGGAAHYSKAAIEEAVAAARAHGADLVVVQLHGGYQFADVSSDYFGKATRASVDAGADLVIGHHPHVLQGFEIYKDTLIAYSLGNFVFDQDFLSTHPSVILRTVFEGTELLETTLYPVILDGYRPVAVGGDVAAGVLQLMNEASLQNAEAIRLPDRRIGMTPTNAPVTAMVVNRGGRGSVVRVTEASTLAVSFEAADPLSIGGELVQIDSGASGLLVGRDIFGYGSLEDRQADGAAAGGLEWSTPPQSLVIEPSSPEGPWVVRLDRTSQHLNEIVARTAARVSMPAHRWFDSDGSPVDGTASYSVRVWGKRVGAGIPFIRVAFYEFDDTDPTRAPDSTPLETIDIELPLVNDAEWHELWVELPPLPEDANTALVGVGLAPPESQSGTVWIDGLQVIEWRSADETPEGTWVTAEYIMSSTAGERTLTIAGR
ncbi:MAG: CapA family protein [bacterium]|nr:CapA family protein [bacterium]